MPRNRRRLQRIADLYLIYIFSHGDVKEPVSLGPPFIHDGDNFGFTFHRSSHQKTLDYFIQKNWVILNKMADERTQSVCITSLGIDQAEDWEEEFLLDKRLTGRSYWISVDWDADIGDSAPIDKQDFLQELLENMLSDFDAQDLRGICFKMFIEYDDLPGEGRKNKCRELVVFAARRKLLPDLIQICREERPNTNWANPKSA